MNIAKSFPNLKNGNGKAASVHLGTVSQRVPNFTPVANTMTAYVAMVMMAA